MIEWLDNTLPKPMRLDLELNDNMNNIDIETINNNRATNITVSWFN